MFHQACYSGQRSLAVVTTNSSTSIVYGTQEDVVRSYRSVDGCSSSHLYTGTRLFSTNKKRPGNTYLRLALIFVRLFCACSKLSLMKNCIESRHRRTDHFFQGVRHLCPKNISTGPPPPQKKKLAI